MGPCFRRRSALAVPVLLFSRVLAAEAVPPPGDPVAAARSTVAKWAETEQLLAKERRDWQQGREILQSRIEVVRGELVAMQSKMTELRSSTSDTDRKRTELGAEDAALRGQAASLASSIGELEAALHRLAPRLPEPLRDKLKPLYGRMPADPARTQVTIAERFQNVVGILNEVNKFNGEITMVSEVRTLADGKPAQVRTVYVGLAQAYFVSQQGEAGIGRPGSEGWEWSAANQVAPQVGEIVEILQSKAKPKFIPLPVQVQ